MNNVKNKIAQYGLLALTLIATVQVGLFVRKHSSVASPQKKLLN